MDFSSVVKRQTEEKFSFAVAAKDVQVLVFQARNNPLNKGFFFIMTFWYTTYTDICLLKKTA